LSSENPHVDADIARERLLAETRKLEAESEKIHAEAMDLKRPPLKRPSAWIAVASTVVALIGGSLAIPFGYFSKLQQLAHQEQEKSALQTQVSELKMSLANLQLEKMKGEMTDATNQKKDLEQQKNALVAQITDLSGQKQKQESELTAARSKLTVAEQDVRTANWNRFQSLANRTLNVGAFLRDHDLKELGENVRQLRSADQAEAEKVILELVKKRYGDESGKFAVSAIMLMGTSKAIYKEQLNDLVTYRAANASLESVFYSYGWQVLNDLDVPLTPDQRLSAAKNLYGRIKAQPSFNAAGENAASFVRTINPAILAGFREPYIEYLREIWRKSPQDRGNQRTFVDCGEIIGVLCLERAAAAAQTDEVLVPAGAITFQGSRDILRYNYEADGRTASLKKTDLQEWLNRNALFPLLGNMRYETLQNLPEPDFIKIFGRVPPPN
jgi:hypothetical protein